MLIPGRHITRTERNVTNSRDSIKKSSDSVRVSFKAVYNSIGKSFAFRPLRGAALVFDRYASGLSTAPELALENLTYILSFCEIFIVIYCGCVAISSLWREWLFHWGFRPVLFQTLWQVRCCENLIICLRFSFYCFFHLFNVYFKCPCKLYFYHQYFRRSCRLWK